MGWIRLQRIAHHSSYSELITTKVKMVEPEEKEILTGAIVIFKNQNSYIHKVLAQYNVQNMKFSIRLNGCEVGSDIKTAKLCYQRRLGERRKKLRVPIRHVTHTL